MLNDLFRFLAFVQSWTRPALFVATCAAAVACGISWAARTKRIGPFTPLGRFAREKVDPMLQSVEAPVRRAGGSAASVPWWGLLAFAVLGILALQLLGYVIGMLFTVIGGFSGGPRSALRALAELTFSVIQLALLIRVISSWFGGLARVRWLRWTYSLTEPLLGPLRNMLPALGPFDISPIVLFYLLRFVGDFVIRSI
jgi:YggT family protein